MPMLRLLKAVVRPPMRAARKALWLARRKRIVRRYLSSTRRTKLQVGTGFNGHDDWLNADILPRNRSHIYLNATQRMPFQNNTFDFIFTEHMIEHIGYRSARQFVQECYRVLRPGGVLRVSTPDLGVVTAMYANPVALPVDRYIDFLTRRTEAASSLTKKAFAVNNYFYNWGHTFLFDRGTLATVLEAAGFTTLTWHAPQESDHVELRGLEKHGLLVGDEEFNAWQSMTVEATKP